MNIAAKLTSAGVYPPEGVKILQWLSTPDGWGITLHEADTAAAVARGMDLWRAAGAGFFKATRTAPASQIDGEMIEGLVKLGAELSTLFKS